MPQAISPFQLFCLPIYRASYYFCFFADVLVSISSKFTMRPPSNKGKYYWLHWWNYDWNSCVNYLFQTQLSFQLWLSWPRFEYPSAPQCLWTGQGFESKWQLLSKHSQAEMNQDQGATGWTASLTQNWVEDLSSALVLYTSALRAVVVLLFVICSYVPTCLKICLGL